MNSLDETDKYAIDLASEKRASNWLNALPLNGYNFNLNKSEFRDGIYLRYGWEPTKTPLTCACGAYFNLTHALHCAKGGYTHIRHNGIRDTFANLTNEVCHDVEIEPKLQPLQGEIFVNNSTTTEDEAQLDIKANRLWGSRFSRAFVDVKICNPHAKTSRKLHKNAYKYHETLKNSKYQQRILNVEQSSFCPLIFGGTGGAAPTATRTIQRLAEKLSEKRQESYAESINYIRTKISFALLRSSILCIRGCRSLRKVQFIDNSISTTVEEGRLR